MGYRVSRYGLGRHLSDITAERSNDLNQPPLLTSVIMTMHIPDSGYNIMTWGPSGKLRCPSLCAYGFGSAYLTEALKEMKFQELNTD